MSQSIDESLFQRVTQANNPALSRALRQLDSSTYEICIYNDSVEVAYFMREEMAYIAASGGDLDLIESAQSARGALDQWLFSQSLTPEELELLDEQLYMNEPMLPDYP